MKVIVPKRFNIRTKDDIKFTVIKIFNHARKYWECIMPINSELGKDQLKVINIDWVLYSYLLIKWDDYLIWERTVTEIVSLIYNSYKDDDKFLR